MDIKVAGEHMRAIKVGNPFTATGITEVTIPTDDAEQPLTIRQLDNGEICVLWDGEFYFSAFGPQTAPAPA